jgi:hypothetical protein
MVAMLKMKKLDIAELKRARASGGASLCVAQQPLTLQRR